MKKIIDANLKEYALKNDQDKKKIKDIWYTITIAFVLITASLFITTVIFSHQLSSSELGLIFFGLMFLIIIDGLIISILSKIVKYDELLKNQKFKAEINEKLNDLDKMPEKKKLIISQKLKKDDYYVYLSIAEKRLADKIDWIKQLCTDRNSEYFSEKIKNRRHELKLINKYKEVFIEKYNTLEETSKELKKDKDNRALKDELEKAKLDLKKIKADIDKNTHKIESLKTLKRVAEFLDDNSAVHSYLKKFINKYGYIPEAELLADYDIIYYMSHSQLASSETAKNTFKSVSQIIYQNYHRWIDDIIEDKLDLTNYNNELSDLDFYERYGILNINVLNKVLKVAQLYKSLVSQGLLDSNSIDREAFYCAFAYLNIPEVMNKIANYEKVYGDFNNQENIDEIIINNKNDINLPEYIAISMYACEFLPSKNQKHNYSYYYLNAINLINACIEKHKNKKFLDSLDLDEDEEEKITINDIDLMSGSEFEHFVADLFTKMGYKTYVTKASNDQGIDVIAGNNDIKVAIQAKCYSGIVGNHAIMEAVGGMKYYNANKCMVVTNRNFTKSAIELARANNVELWDRKTLEEKIQEYL